MAGELEFTLKIVDRMSAPLRAALAPMKAMDSQLKSILSSLDALGSRSIKIPSVLAAFPTKAARGATEKIGPMFGPGRKEAAAAARYAERQQAQAARLAERQVKQQQIAYARQLKDQERAFAKHQAQQVRIAKVAEANKIKSAKQAADAAKAFQASEAAALTEGIAAVGAAASAAAIGALALGGAFAYVAYSGASLAIHASEAKNDTLDMLEAMLGSQKAARETYEQINAITKTVAVSQEAAETMARELTAAGVTNQAMLVGAVKAIAQTESVLKGAGSKIQGIVEKAAQTGKFEINAKKLTGTGVQLSVLYQELADRTGVGVKQVEAQLKAGKISAETGIAALTAVLDKKFGAVAAKQAMDIGAQFQRFRDNVSRLFEDVNTEPFLAALDKLLSLVDQATPAGKALHSVMTAVFDGIFEAVAVVAPYVTTFFKGLVLIGLKVANAFRPLVKQIRDSFGGEQTDNIGRFQKLIISVASGIGWLAEKFVALAQNQTVLTILGYALKGIVVAVVGAVAVAGLLATAFGVVVSAAAAVNVAVLATVGYLGSLGSKAAEAGKNLVMGLVTGITNAASWLYDAVANLAKNALGTFKKFFGIESPSKVMAKMGGHMTSGLSIGLKRGADSSAGAMLGVGARLGTRTAEGSQLAMVNRVQQLPGNDNALRSRTDQPRLAEPRERRRRGEAPQINVTIEAGAFVGVRDAEQIREMLPSMMADAFEQAALMTGTGD